MPTDPDEGGARSIPIGGKSGATAHDIRDEGPPVALVHGLGLNRRMWRCQLPALTPRFTEIWYDLLGHGDNAKDRGSCCLSILADQLARLLDGLEIQRCSVVGFPLGWWICHRFAQDHPHRAIGKGGVE